MKLRTFLQLGRVSNLPTVWTNVLTAIVLSGARPTFGPVLAMVLAMTLFYVGGMFLNDAFDAGIDRRERPDRPIPRGDVTVGAVFASGFAMLAAAIAVVTSIALTADTPHRAAPIAAALLAIAIIAYDRHHKDNPLSPLLMGACRVLVYVTVALGVSGQVEPDIVVAAALLLCYLIGLTYAAKHETGQPLTRYWPLLFLAIPFIVMLPSIAGIGTAIVFTLFAVWVLLAVRLIVGRHRNVRRAIGYLIAGISLLDALLIAASGTMGLAVLAGAAFAATLLLQRRIAGT